MLKTIKQFFCRHDYEIIYKKPVGFFPGGPLVNQIKKVCRKCGKEKFEHKEG